MPRRAALIVALCVAAILLVVGNLEVVEVRLVGWSIAAGLGWVILASLVVGYVAGLATRSRTLSSEEADHRSRG